MTYFQQGLLLSAIQMVFVSVGTSQAPAMLRSDRNNHIIDRMEVLGYVDSLLHRSTQYLDRQEWTYQLLHIAANKAVSTKDKWDLSHFLADNWEFLPDSITNQSGYSKQSYDRKPWLGWFYPTTGHFVNIETPAFSLILNPVVHLSSWQGLQDRRMVFQNTRGIDLRAYIDKKVYVYSRILENQRSFPLYADQRIQEYQAVPGQGSWQPFQSSVISAMKGYDYFNATAYLGFAATKNIHLQFGHGSHFIGHGIRSLLLSDHAHNYLYFKIDTRMWRFRYQNIFAELASTSAAANPLERLLPKKYMAAHYLSFRPHKNWEVGLFESVIFSRDKMFELQYLNPVILYRSVEQWIDSPDNVLLGLNLRWKPLSKVEMYSQLLLDEFRLSEIRKQTGWWANKVGWQAGMKYYNAFGVDHLDMQLEYNVVRPYTYTHWDTLTAIPQYAKASYTHYNQPLAHPLGANFQEFLMQLKYVPAQRWLMNVRLLHALYGADPVGKNWGGNILLNNGSKEQLYGNVVGQGQRVTVSSAFVDIGYELAHNLYLDVQILLRKAKTTEPQWQNYVGGGVRWNAFSTQYDY